MATLKRQKADGKWEYVDVTGASLPAHTADGTAHGIGNKAQLATSHKTTLVGAINEAFTSASNGKGAIGAAITGVDPAVVIPSNPSFDDLAASIGKINVGRKWATGTSSDPQYAFEVGNLTFRPSVVIVHTTKYATDNTDRVNNLVLLDPNKFARSIYAGDHFSLWSMKATMINLTATASSISRPMGVPPEPQEAYITDKGFVLGSGAGTIGGFTWLAIE